MSDKKELMVALKGTEVAAGIDMRLSKGDIIDMVVEERKEELEQVLAQLQRERETLTEELKNVGDKYEKALVEEIKKEHKSLIKAFTKTFPAFSVSDETNSFHNWQLEWSYENGVGKNRKLHVGKKQHREECSMRARVRYKEKTDGRYDSRGSDLDLCKSLDKKGVAQFEADADVVATKLQAALEKIDQTKAAISDLSKKGGRFKAEFTKRMLAGTEAGQSILGSLDGVRNIVKGIK